MNSPENQDWERKLQELEAEVNQTSSPPPKINTEPGQPLQRETNNSQKLENIFNQVRDWFNSLPTAGKVAVVAIALVVGFSLLRTVLQLVASLISIAILGVVLYLLYKFFIAPDTGE